MPNGGSAIGPGGIASIRLDRLVPAIQQARGRELELTEQQRQLAEQEAVRQALAGADLTNRQDVLGRLQQVAPTQALQFAQGTRGQQEEDIEVALFAARRLANAARQVTNQQQFDAIKRQAIELGIPQEAVDRLGPTFDKQRLDEAADALDALSGESLNAAIQELEPIGEGFVGARDREGNIVPATIKSKATAKNKEGELRKFKDTQNGITFEITQERRGGKWVEIGKARETPTGNKPSDREKRRQAMIDAGAPESVADGFANGTIKEIKNPFTFESTFINLGTSDPSQQILGTTNRKGEWVPNPAVFTEEPPAPTAPAAPAGPAGPGVQQQRGGAPGSFQQRRGRQRIENGRLVTVPEA